MTKLSRRSILAGLAASPLIATSASAHLARGAAPHPPGSRKLFLYLHGATILDLRQDGMIVHAPRVTMLGQLAHDYRIGYGKNGEGDEIYSGAPLALLGFAGAPKPPKIYGTQTPYLGPKTLDTAGNFCSLITPLPAGLTPLRQIQRDSACGDFFPGNSELMNLQSLPLVLRADFGVEAGESVRLFNTQWKDDGSLNPVIHLRAEPSDTAYADHDAFLALSTTLGTSVELASGYSKAAAKYKIPDERTLIEVLNGSADGGIAVPPCSKEVPLRVRSYLYSSRPANCVSLVVNNTGQPLI